jgi:hypothetical protein
MAGELDPWSSDLTAGMSELGVQSGLRLHRVETRGYTTVTWERRLGLVYVKMLEAAGTGIGGTGIEGSVGWYLVARVGDKAPVGVGTGQTGRIVVLMG